MILVFTSQTDTIKEQHPSPGRCLGGVPEEFATAVSCHAGLLSAVASRIVRGYPDAPGLKRPLPQQRFWAVGSILPGKASVMRMSLAYCPAQEWLRAW